MEPKVIKDMAARWCIRFTSGAASRRSQTGGTPNSRRSAHRRLPLVARKGNPEVTAYLEAENAYTDVILKPTQDLQEKALSGNAWPHPANRLERPLRSARLFLFHKKPRKENSIRFISGSFGENGPEELLLDLNALAEGHSFLGLSAFEVSDDNRFLAYSIDTTGFRQYTLQIKNLLTGESLPFALSA